MKKKRNNKKLAVFIIASISITIVIIILLINLLSKLLIEEKQYKIESRIEELAEYEKNNVQSQTLSWLKVQGTNIDYPVLYFENEEELLNQKGDYLWGLENPDEPLRRTVVLGHNIRNVSSNPLITYKNHTRFEQLLSFIYYDFAKDNQYIQYTRDGKDYLYKIFSVSFIEDKDLIYYGNLTDNEFREYIDHSLDNSYFDYNEEITDDDKIITLITCTRFFQQQDAEYKFKIEGKLVNSEEKNLNSKVDKKDNYKEIEDILKGGEVNEQNA